MEKLIEGEKLLNLYEAFIKDSSRGIRTKKDGKRIRYSTIKNYGYVYKLLQEYEASDFLKWKVYYHNRLNQREREQAQRYNKRFYIDFTRFLHQKGVLSHLSLKPLALDKTNCNVQAPLFSKRCNSSSCLFQTKIYP